jgi:hypothetical protein
VNEAEMPEVLYHYCSNEAFEQIVVSKSIWLSALSLSNDSMEGKISSKIMNDLARENVLPSLEIQLISKIFSRTERIIDGLRFCLSEKGDLLSQWRGYASDATGVSIGFSTSYLKDLMRKENNSAPIQVEYDYVKHRELVQPSYARMKKLIDSGGIIESGSPTASSKAEYLDMVEELAYKSFHLKSKGFEEEREWRLLSLFVKNGKVPCSFRVGQNQIIPYRGYKLSAQRNPIIEVWLGPKHVTPKWIIESFLKRSGFDHVHVESSAATYR